MFLQYPKGRDVEDGDEFEFNDDFAAPLYRIKVVRFFLGLFTLSFLESCNTFLFSM